MRRPVAVLDANVLFPFQLRNVLLHLAAEDLYRPLWSDEILGEMGRALRDHAGLTEEQRSHLFGQMRKYFPDAWGSGYAGAAEGIELVDEGDRHVIALARHYEADVIVTSNLKHFAAETLEPLELRAMHPDDFCVELARSDLSGVLRAAERHRASLKAHPLRADEYLRSLEDKAGLRQTSRLLLESGFLTRAVLTQRAQR